MTASVELSVLFVFLCAGLVGGMNLCGNSSCYCFTGAGKHIIYCYDTALTQIPLIQEADGKYSRLAEQFWLEGSELVEVSLDRMNQQMYPALESLYVRDNDHLDCESLLPYYDYGWQIVTDCPEPPEDNEVLADGTELDENLPGMLVELHGYGVDVSSTAFINETYTEAKVEEYRNWQSIILGLISLGVIVAIFVVVGVAACIVFVYWRKRDNIQSADIMAVVMASRQH